MAGVKGLEPSASAVTGQRSKPAELHPRDWHKIPHFFRIASKIDGGRQSLKIVSKAQQILAERVLAEHA